MLTSMSFPQFLLIWVAVLVVAIVSGSVARVIGGRHTGNMPD